MPFSYPTKRRSYGRDKFNMAPVFCKEDGHNPRQGLLTCLPLRTQSLTELKEPLTCLLTTASSVLGSESAKPMSPIPIMAFLCFQSPPPICLFGQEIVFYVSAQAAHCVYCVQLAGFSYSEKLPVFSWSRGKPWKAAFVGSLENKLASAATQAK